MRRIKNQILAQLLMQLRFAPRKQRAKQLDAAEKLFALIDKTKDYPFDFVCFHITGFRPSGSAGQELIKGGELADDLPTFIARLSAGICPPADQQNQKVYTTEELAETLSVSTKTINRWRNNGLVARKFLFGHGKKYLGFLRSSVDAFLHANPSLVSGAKNLKRLTKKQKQQIIKQAASLAAKTPLSRYRIIEKIAAQTGVSHETIRCTLLNYENASPDKPIFKKPGGVINPAQAAEIYRLYRQNCSIKELTQRFYRTKSSIYRIINERRARELLAKKIEFIASNEFLQPDAAEKILIQTIDAKKTASQKKPEPFKLAEGSLSRYLQIARTAPVLNREQELRLFRRCNFLKYLASLSRDGMKTSRTSSAQIREIEKYLAEADEIKKIIIEANLRLVVTIATKHAAAGANLLDLIGEGNLSLMHAVEKFDYTRGFRFATYASWAIAKDYARKIPAQLAHQDKIKSESMETVQRDLRIAESADFAAIERAHKSLLAVIRDNLDQREQYVIVNHFGLMGTLVKKEKKTLTLIGQDLGLSKERIRQIELIALQKLRHSLSPEQFDLLTG